MLRKLQQEMQRQGSPEKAKILSRFFKTGKGQYGEGDVFLGLMVPTQRKIANTYRELSLPDIQKLLASKIHEHRFTALLILTQQFAKADESRKEQIFKFYLRNIKRINNWDLVDLSAPNIVGKYLLDKDRSILRQLATSDNLWSRRIAILSTFEFIKHGEHRDTFAIAKILLRDPHDLIHKAVGWMLREVGKKVGEDVEETFLNKHYRQMPRTMLRYAIERFAAKWKARLGEKSYRSPSTT